MIMPQGVCVIAQTNDHSWELMNFGTKEKKATVDCDFNQILENFSATIKWLWGSLSWKWRARNSSKKEQFYILTSFHEPTSGSSLRILPSVQAFHRNAKRWLWFGFFEFLCCLGWWPQNIPLWAGGIRHFLINVVTWTFWSITKVNLQRIIQGHYNNKITKTTKI